MGKRGLPLTSEEIKELKEYLQLLDELSAKEPARLSGAEWDELTPKIRKTGKVPEEYAGKIGVRVIVDDITEEKHFDYYDIAWEEWHEKIFNLNCNYNSIVKKALTWFLFRSELEERSTISEKGGGSIAGILNALINAIENNDSEEVRALIPAIKSHRLERLDFPLDKVNSNVWKLLEETTNGQLKYNIGVEKKGSKEHLNIVYSIDFNNENVSLSKKLDPYDKRVYYGLAGFYNKGTDVITLQQIYNAMGYKGRAGAADLKRINDSITKMHTAQIVVDNKQEAQAYKYPHFRYDGSLLPMERMQEIEVNGQIARGAVHLFREPPLVSFARERNQITTISVKLLTTPLSKTNANLALEDYFIEQISHMKHGAISKKMLFDTIYKKAGITTKMQKQRAPEKITTLLGYYKECGFIKDFRMSKDGITIES